MEPRIFKIYTALQWERRVSLGHLPWAPVDEADGFVHLSAIQQVLETANKHFAGQQGLVLVEIDPAALPTGSLRWEVSRAGDRFPHVYASIPLEAALQHWGFPGSDTGFALPAAFFSPSRR
ncbi:MAG: DUF952 domain-containing protein [Nannocystaceae bacterium]|nr:DUF952 domain-containing protein [Nannocystaceae bacterium]